MANLKGFKGYKRVDNYVKGVFKPRDAILNNPKTSREDLEGIAIELERQNDLLEGYKQVERIIAERTAAANKDVDHEHRKISTYSLLMFRFTHRVIFKHSRIPLQVEGSHLR